MFWKKNVETYLTCLDVSNIEAILRFLRGRHSLPQQMDVFNPTNMSRLPYMVAHPRLDIPSQITIRKIKSTCFASI